MSEVIEYRPLFGRLVDRSVFPQKFAISECLSSGSIDSD